MTLRQQFAYWKREAREKALGRIRFDLNRWTFSENAPPPADEEDRRSRFPQEDRNGVMMELIRGRGTWCENPKWQGEFPLSKNGNYNVPYGKCSKCEYYLKGGKKIRFPRCLWAAQCKTEPEARIEAAHNMLNLIDRAVEDVNEMFGDPS